MSQRDGFLSQFIRFNAKQRILWYSGPEPFTQYQSLSQYFHTQIRMPMTPTKLDSLVNTKSVKVKNPHQEKINSLPKARILAVDDMEMNLKLLKTWLNNSPISLTTCTSGQEAVNYCQTQEFDLILMDVQMPGMDGLQASMAIRKSALNMGTPIIAVTAHAFREEQERLLSSGMDDYLPKPIEMGSLLDLIRAWCHAANPSQIILPSLDWNLALKRANQNYDAAKELLSDFIDLLPDTQDVVQKLWNENDYNALKDEIHKLHGACCYTGVPRLQSLAGELESSLKLGQHLMVAEHLPSLTTELTRIQEEGSALLKNI